MAGDNPGEGLTEDARAALDRARYGVYPILSTGASPLRVLNAFANPNDALAKIPIGPNGFDLVVNGTYMSAGLPAGPVVHGGHADRAPDPRNATLVARRGGVAVLEDGSVRVGQQDGNGLDALHARFDCGEGRRLTQFLGGGALLLADGMAADLALSQHFKGGLQAQQFHDNCNNTLVGIANGRAYIVISPRYEAGTGTRLFEDLRNAGFTSLLEFDGSSGFYFRDAKGRRGDHGNNGTGLAVRIYRAPKPRP